MLISTSIRLGVSGNGFAGERGKIVLLSTRMLVLACLAAMCATFGALVLSADALALPEGRVYEMVSPLFKDGQGANLSAVAPDGESVLFGSIGTFAGTLYAEQAGNAYLARRGSMGWSTTSVDPPPVATVGEFSSTLDRELTVEEGQTKFEGSKAAIKYLFHNLNVPDTPENWEVGPTFETHGTALPPSVVGISADLCHQVLWGKGYALLPEANVPYAPLYDLAFAPAEGCRRDGSSGLQIVSVKNSLGVHGEPAVINPFCPAEIGSGNIFYSGLEFSQLYGTLSVRYSTSFDAISADGGEIFFTTAVERHCSTQGFVGAIHQLFVRLGGQKTVEVSKPVSTVEAEACDTEIPCPGAGKRASASFEGASKDGSRAYFITNAQLVPGDTDTSSNLYLAAIGCPIGQEGCSTAEKVVTSMTRISTPVGSGEGAEVQGVTTIAMDGPRVYFVANGVLSVEPNAEGESPVKGADNLYIYDAQKEKVAFVAGLCSGPELSGLVTNGRCPTTLDSELRGTNDTSLFTNGKEAQSTPDGRFLVFSTYARLVKGDTDNAKDVYRYDAVTGVLDRVSLGEAGADENGNHGDSEKENSDASIARGGQDGNPTIIGEYGLGTRAISGDGSRIVFSSAGPLSERAVNGLLNIYEWHREPGQPEGEVSLISSGSSLTSDGDPTISSSGRDIVFVTTAGLVPEDVEEDKDIYDARLGGGFPPVGTERQPCSGDACQGPLTNPAPLLVPGSVSQAPGENLAAPITAKAAPRARPKKCSRGRKLTHNKCFKSKKRTKKFSQGRK